MARRLMMRISDTGHNIGQAVSAPLGVARNFTQTSKPSSSGWEPPTYLIWGAADRPWRQFSGAPSQPGNSSFLEAPSIGKPVSLRLRLENREDVLVVA